MTGLHHTTTAFAVAASLAVAGPAFAEAAAEMEAPGLSPRLFLASADTGESQGILLSPSSLSILEISTSASTASADEMRAMAKKLLFVRDVLGWGGLIVNAALAIDAMAEAEADPTKNPNVSGPLNMLFGGAGYIYNGKRIPLGVVLTLWTLVRGFYVQGAIQSEAQRLEKLAEAATPPIQDGKASGL